jgi:hypothetical protein
MASGRCLPIVENIAQTGTAILGVSGQEDLVLLKKKCLNKLSILGNLNGIEMRRWSTEKAEEEVRKAILQAGIGGGFILSDNHGEIPWQPSAMVFARNAQNNIIRIWIFIMIDVNNDADQKIPLPGRYWPGISIGFPWQEPGPGSPLFQSPR